VLKKVAPTVMQSIETLSSLSKPTESCEVGKKKKKKEKKKKKHTHTHTHTQTTLLRIAPISIVMSARLSCPRVSEQLPMDGLREI
jgi:hypothetical protein